MNERQIKALGPSQVDKLRRKGLCFQCRERQQPGHKCSSKREILALTMVDDEDDEGREEHIVNEGPSNEDNTDCNTEINTPVMSISTMTHVLQHETVRVVAYVKKMKLTSIVDIGSTHNFIESSIGKQLKLPLNKLVKFKVQFVDGETMECEGICKGFLVRIGDYTLISIFYMVCVSASKVVLGAH